MLHTSLQPQVEFYAPWSPACIHLEPVVAELSLKYSCTRLQFGRVDAPRCGAEGVILGCTQVGRSAVLVEGSRGAMCCGLLAWPG